MSVKLAIFDCDGTLVDSQANICRAMEHAFAGEGLPPPDLHKTRRVVGLSLVEAMRAMLPDADDALHIALAERYKNAFHELRGNGMIDEPLYDGLLELLDRLARQGWKLAVATGKSDRGLALCLAHHGIANRFVSLQTADRHPSKPHPAMALKAMADTGANPSRTVMIGDTSFDMEMGVNAGIAPVGVDWGYHDAHELTSAGAIAVAMTMQELGDILEQRK